MRARRVSSRTSHPPHPLPHCLSLQDQIPQVVEKAAVSEGSTAEAQRRAAACGKALDLHLTRLRRAPGRPACRCGGTGSSSCLAAHPPRADRQHLASQPHPLVARAWPPGRSRARTGSWAWPTCLSCGRSACASLASQTCTGGLGRWGRAVASKGGVGPAPAQHAGPAAAPTARLARDPGPPGHRLHRTRAGRTRSGRTARRWRCCQTCWRSWTRSRRRSACWPSYRRAGAGRGLAVRQRALRARHRPGSACIAPCTSSTPPQPALQRRDAPPLLTDSPPNRLAPAPQGVLAANIFDWGAKACVDLYQSATILEMYREVRRHRQPGRRLGRRQGGCEAALGTARVASCSQACLCTHLPWAALHAAAGAHAAEPPSLARRRL